MAAPPPSPKVPSSPSPGLQLDKISVGLGSLTPEQLKLFEEADFYAWNSQLALAESKIEKLAATHALFSLLYAKIAVLKAIISEYEPECETAFQRLDNAQKLATQWSEAASGESWFGVSPFPFSFTCTSLTPCFSVFKKVNRSFAAVHQTNFVSVQSGK